MQRTARHRGLGALMVLACLVLVISGCQIQDLNFIEDTRVQITAPENRSQVRLPVTIEWEVSDFVVTGPDGEAVTPDEVDAGYFGVFVDRAPQPPGEPLAWHARDDGSCIAARGCPDEAWFSQRRIYTSTDTSFTIEQVPSVDDDRREFHEVIIILLDPDGHRIGESAFAVEFEVVRST